MDHALARALGYLAALAGWGAVAWAVPGLWPRRDAPHFSHPGRELAVALTGIAGTLAMGLGYVRGWLLPATRLDQPLLDVANQLIVFTPILLVPIVRRHPAATLWLPTDHVIWRAATGVLLAIAGLSAYALAAGAGTWLGVMRSVYHHTNLPFLVQRLLEDAAAAILLVRVAGVLGPRAAPSLTAVLLAAGPVIAFAAGAEVLDLPHVVLDAALGAVVVAVVQRSRDIWWFWGVHFAMDLAPVVS